MAPKKRPSCAGALAGFTSGCGDGIDLEIFKEYGLFPPGAVLLITVSGS